jgi:hypothetical protein
VTYRERCDADLYSEHPGNIVLSRHSTIGPWLVMGLGVTLALFLSYLVCSNLLLTTLEPPSPERSLRIIAESAPATTVSLADHGDLFHQYQWGPATTSVPRSRATNALLGGEGPALLPGSLAVNTRDTLEVSPGAAAIPR